MNSIAKYAIPVVCFPTAPYGGWSLITTTLSLDECLQQRFGAFDEGVLTYGGVLG